MIKSAKRGGLLSVLALCALAPAAVAGPVGFVVLNFPDAVATSAYGINPAGDIVGSYTDGAKKTHGFVLRGATFSAIDVPGAGFTEAYGITPRGDIVGQYRSGGIYHGFLLRDGTLTYPVDVPGQPNTMPLGISPEDTIVGCVHGGPNGMYGFVMTADGVATTPTPLNTMLYGINPSGEVVGFGPRNPGESDTSYVISNGVISWFSFSGAKVTRARGISATGDIVGVYQDAASSKTHGFLFSHGAVFPIDVDLAGVLQTRAIGINAVGDIVGDFKDSTGTHGYVMSRRPR